MLEFDDFGLPIKKFIMPVAETTDSDAQDATDDANTGSETRNGTHEAQENDKETKEAADGKNGHTSGGDTEDADAKDAQEARAAATSPTWQDTTTERGHKEPSSPSMDAWKPDPASPSPAKDAVAAAVPSTPKTPNNTAGWGDKYAQAKTPEGSNQTHRRDISFSSPANGKGISEYSHQHVLMQPEEHDDKPKEDDDGGWQEMPSYARYDMYDDDDRLIAREHDAAEDETYGYAGLGGAGKGYTRVIMDEDAESATSMDEHTQYLFKDPKSTSMGEDDEARDAVSQMQATKDLLTEGQRIAYVGVVRLEIVNMVKEAELEITKGAKRAVVMGAEAVKMWGQKMMIRLYAHMDISDAEQIMIEQLAAHGVMAQDLTPALHANSRVSNPMAEEKASRHPEHPGLAATRRHTRRRMRNLRRCRLRTKRTLARSCQRSRRRHRCRQQRKLILICDGPFSVICS